MSNQLLSKTRLQEIEDLACHQLATASSSGYDLSHIVDAIVQREGLHLMEAELEDISGVLYKNTHGAWIILLNREDSTRRKLFTIAHELGHYFLHRDLQDEFVDGAFVHNCFGRSEDSKYQDLEVEANEFAGNLIMPKAHIDALMQSVQRDPKQKPMDSEEVSQMAAYFKVSPHAMLVRLKNLNYAV